MLLYLRVVVGWSVVGLLLFFCFFGFYVVCCEEEDFCVWVCVYGRDCGFGEFGFDEFVCESFVVEYV